MLLTILVILVGASNTSTTGYALLATATVPQWTQLSTSNLTDITTSALTQNDVLLYNGTKWANSPVIYSNLTTAQSNITTLQNQFHLCNQVLLLLITQE